MSERIYKRELANGKVKWDVLVDIPLPDGKGRKQVKKRFDTEREARAWYLEQESLKAKGLAVVPDPRTIQELMQYWLEHYAKHQVSASTFSQYECTIRNHVSPQLGDIKVQALTTSRLQQYCTDKVNEGCHPRTIMLAMIHLKQALREAVQLGWLSKNPAEGVRRPRWTPREMQTWSPQEAKKFLTVAKEHGKSEYGPIWLLALSLGLRKAELTGLRWSDINLDQKTLRVQQSIGRAGSKLVVKPPKTRNSRRPANLSKTVIAALREHKIKQLEERLKFAAEYWRDNDLVFTTVIGTAIHPSNLSDEFKRLVRLAKVPKITVHSLRHTYATLALASGEDPKKVSEALGHATVAITMQVYRHIQAHERQALADKMEVLLLLAED